MKKRSLLLLFIMGFSITLIAQTSGPPRHMFFEYGPLSKSNLGPLATKNNSHFAIGLKYHHWKEEKPFQFEIDMDYRRLTFYSDSNTQTKLGLFEMYLGPRMLISKTLPLYPTASALAGFYYNFGSVAGFSALLSAGIYYNFTKPGQDRNGVSLELTYRPVQVKYNPFTIPAAFAVRLGFFF